MYIKYSNNKIMTITIQFGIGMNHHSTFARVVKTILVLILDTKMAKILWMAHLIWPSLLNRTLRDSEFIIKAWTNSTESLCHFTQLPSHFFITGEATKRWYLLHISFRFMSKLQNSIEFYLNSFNFSLQSS